MTVKLMRMTIPLIIMACLAMTAGAALTSLPDSSHYSGISYYTASPSAGKIQNGRVEFAVYDTQTSPSEVTFTAPGQGRYVYAYQIFNYSTNDFGMTNTTVPYFVIESLGVNAVTSKSNIGTFNDATGGVNASLYSLTTNTTTSGTPPVATTTTSVVFEFANGILAAGENSWYLILRSNQDWVKGTYTLETPPKGDIPAPMHNPEPASLLLMGLGAAGLFKRKRK